MGTPPLHEWPLESVWWYFGWCKDATAVGGGTGAARPPPTGLTMTVFARGLCDTPTLGGNVLSFSNKEDFVKWVASCLVAEFYDDAQPKTFGGYL